MTHKPEHRSCQISLIFSRGKSKHETFNIALLSVPFLEMPISSKNVWGRRRREDVRTALGTAAGEKPQGITAAVVLTATRWCCGSLVLHNLLPLGASCPCHKRSSRENRPLPECDLLKRILYLSLRVAALKDIILPFTSLGHWGGKGQAGTTDVATVQLPSPPTGAPLSTWVCSKPHGHANLKVCFQEGQTGTLGQCL